MSYSTGVIVAMPALNETLSFVLQLLLAFGLIFELPLFVFFLARLGIVTADMMRKFRRYSILANVIIAAILTPPDVMSQMLMAGPLILLYELSILIAAVFGKKKQRGVQQPCAGLRAFRRRWWGHGRPGRPGGGIWHGAGLQHCLIKRLIEFLFQKMSEVFRLCLCQCGAAVWSGGWADRMEVLHHPNIGCGRGRRPLRKSAIPCAVRPPIRLMRPP